MMNYTAVFLRFIHVKVHPQHNRFIFSLYNSDLTILYYTMMQENKRDQINKRQRKERLQKKRNKILPNFTNTFTVFA